MRKTLVVCFALLLIGSLSLMAGQVTKTGILIDARCAKAAGSNAQKVEMHKASCALMDPCVESGYGLFVDGKFYKFNKDGDAQALNYFKNVNKRKTGIKVAVTGDFSGDNVKVEKIATSK